MVKLLTFDVQCATMYLAPRNRRFSGVFLLDVHGSTFKSQLRVERAQLYNMNTKNVLRSLQSFVVLPILATNIAALPLNSTMLPTVAVSTTEEIRLLAETTTDNQQLVRLEKAQKIDNYFKKYHMPLAGFGMKMVLEAEKNGLDPLLIPAIAVRESTGGRHACKSVTFNPFGWGSCKIGFTSYEHAIEKIALNLGGNNPNTAYHYAGKPTIEILEAYNPRTIVARYPEQVIDIMNAIDAMETKSHLE